MSRILILSGTNRPGALSRRFADLLHASYQAKGVPSRVLDLIDLPGDLFVPSSYASKPASFDPWKAAVLESAGIHVVVPEYNGSFPGVLKYFIDLLPFPDSFLHRKVAFLGLGGMWGGLRPVEQLQMVFAYRNAQLFSDRVFVRDVKGKFDASGALVDADLAKRIDAQAAAFAAFAGLSSR